MWKEHLISDVAHFGIESDTKLKLYDPPYQLRDGSSFTTSNNSKEAAQREKKKHGDSNFHDTEFLKYSCVEDSQAMLLLSNTTHHKLEEKLLEDRGFIDYVSYHKERRIHIRTILGTLMNHAENKHVLIEEIISDLPLILKQQDLFTSDNIGKLKALAQKWKRSSGEKHFSSINLKQLADIFDSFDIDKSKITLIPDAMSSLFCINKFHGAFCINSNCGKLISSSHACFYIFGNFVYITDYSEVYHCGHETPVGKCICKVKKEILDLYTKWLDGDENLYRTKKEVDVVMEDLVNSAREYHQWKKNTFMLALRNKKPTEMVSLGTLLDEKIIALTLEKFHSNKVKEEARRVKVQKWRMETVSLILSLTVFLGSKHPKIYNSLIKCITLLMPLAEFKTTDDIERFVAYGHSCESMTKEEIEKRYESFKSRRVKKQLAATAEDVFLDIFENIKDGSFLKNVMEKRPNLDEVLPQEELLENNDAPVNDEVAENQNANEENESTQEPTASSKIGVDWCTKCYRTSQLLSKMKEKYSLKKGEASELENNWKTVQQELGKMKKRENEVEAHFKQKYDSEIEEVKKKVENDTLESYKASVGVIRSENERLKTKISQLEVKNEENEIELLKLRTENEKWTKDFRELARTMEKNYQTAAQQTENLMREEILKLKEEVYQLRIQAITGSQNIEKSIAVLITTSSQPTSSSSSSFSPSPPPVLPKATKSELPSTPNANLDVEKMLNYLKTQKHKLKELKSISEATNIVKRVKLNTFEKAVSDKAANELKTFKMDHEAYLKALEGNILLIENDRQITRDQLISLPKEPTFSPWLMNKYKEVTENMNQRAPQKPQQTTTSKYVPPPPRPPPDEISDKECLLCLENVEVEGSLKCFSCSRRYHEDCISPWLSKNSTCPTCRKTMLDPKEYPPLS